VKVYARRQAVTSEANIVDLEGAIGGSKKRDLQ